MSKKRIRYKSRRPVYGFGINDADYAISQNIDGKPVRCPYYHRWTQMLMRCYSEKYLAKWPTYINCTVAPEWRSFMAFRKWMMAQDWKGKDLDKDIIFPGNKIYSPETCVFVAKYINTLLGDRTANQGKYPKGVCFQKQNKNFVARVRINNMLKSLGSYANQNDAAKAYKKAKRLYLLQIACCEPDIRVKQGLFRHSELLRAI